MLAETFEHENLDGLNGALESYRSQRAHAEESRDGFVRVL